MKVGRRWAVDGEDGRHGGRMERVQRAARGGARPATLRLHVCHSVRRHDVLLRVGVGWRHTAPGATFDGGEGRDAGGLSSGRYRAHGESEAADAGDGR
eukprot:30554-Eustigmatos_ZCMA.PRE.1